MKKIALATCREYPNLTTDEKLLANCLRDFEFDAQPLVWDEPNQNLADYSAVVIRSCWDYHKKPHEFLAWIEKLETDGVKVLNPPAILRWNLDKIYLRELAASGVKIPPTIWFEKGGKGDLANTLAENDWTKPFSNRRFRRRRGELSSLRRRMPASCKRNLKVCFYPVAR